MMGRATEYFDYLHVAPADLAERKELYCSITITDELKASRRKYMAEKRKVKK